MKRAICLILLAALALIGCAKTEDPYRVDTVVYIPADPTDAPESTEMTLPEETEIPETSVEASTEPETAETEPKATEAAKKPAASSKKPSSTKKPSSGKNNSGTSPKPAATESPATEPPAAELPTAESPVEQPSEEMIPATEIVETEPEPTVPPLYDISGYSVGGLETAIKDAINVQRAAAGLGELGLNSRLCAIASCRGYEISRVWSHTRPDGRGYQTVLSDYGFGGSARELLIYVSGSGDGQSVVDQWMLSDSSKDLLLGGFSTVGIGVYRTGGYTYIACLLM